MAASDNSLRYPWLIPAVIMLLAAVFRFANLGYAEFKNDEAINLFLALNWVEHGEFPLVGDGSSILTYNPPFFVWLLCLPLVYTRDPVMVTGFIAALNVFAVGLLWRFGCRWFGLTAGTVAALWCAVNPWAVFYARKIWMPDVLALFTLALFYVHYRVVVDGQRRLVPLVFLLLGVVTQLYPPTVYFALVIGASFIIWRPRPGLRQLLLGGLLLGGLYLPYLWHDAQRGWSNLAQYRKAAAQPARFQPEALVLPFLMTTTIDFWPGRSPGVADVALLLVSGVGAAVLLRRVRERRCAILLLWLLVPIAFLVFHKAPLHRRYFIALLPAAGLLVGLGCAVLADRCGRGRVLFLSLLVLLLLVPQGWCTAQFIARAITAPHLAWLDYGPPLAHHRAAVRELARAGYTDIASVQEQLHIMHPGLRKYDWYATQYLLEKEGTRR